MPETPIAQQVLDFLRQEETDYPAAAKLGEAALPSLMAIIQGSDVGLASKATYLAGLIGGGTQEQALTLAAQHQSPIVRVAAASAVKNLAPGAAERLLGPLLNDGDLGVTKLAMQSVQATKLAGKFTARLQTLSEMTQDSTIQNMAKTALQGVK